MSDPQPVPWWAPNPDTWTGYEITCFLLNLLFPPPFMPYNLYLRWVLLPPTPVVSFESSTKNSWAGQRRAAATTVYILEYYRFKIWKYSDTSANEWPS